MAEPKRPRMDRVVAKDERTNPFNTPETGDESQLLAHEVHTGQDTRSHAEDLDHSFPVDPTWCSPGPTQSPPPPVTPDQMCVSNPHARLNPSEKSPRAVRPVNSPQPRGPPQVLDVPMTQDTVTVWVPGGLDPNLRCCRCNQRMPCGYLVAGPSLLMVVGLVITMWVWLKHGRDPHVMDNPVAASCVLIGPIMTLLGVLGIFIACILHEFHSRRAYDPLQDEAPTEEFL